MNHINRLLRLARKTVHPPVCNAFCIVNHDDQTGKWNASPRLWDGVPYSGNMKGVIPADWESEYDTADEAAEAVNNLFASLNISNPDRVVIIVDDVGAALED